MNNQSFTPLQLLALNYLQFYLPRLPVSPEIQRRLLHELSKVGTTTLASCQEVFRSLGKLSVGNADYGKMRLSKS